MTQPHKKVSGVTVRIFQPSLRFSLLTLLGLTSAVVLSFSACSVYKKYRQRVDVYGTLRVEDAIRDASQINAERILVDEDDLRRFLTSFTQLEVKSVLASKKLNKAERHTIKHLILHPDNFNHVFRTATRDPKYRLTLSSDEHDVVHIVFCFSTKTMWLFEGDVYVGGAHFDEIADKLERFFDVLYKKVANDKITGD